MKVLLVNGSPHKNGSTNRALQEVEKTLQAAGVETEIFWIGNEPIGGCIGCGGGAGKRVRASLGASSRNLPRRRRRRTALSSEALSTMRRPQAI